MNEFYMEETDDMENELDNLELYLDQEPDYLDEEDEWLKTRFGKKQMKRMN